MADNAAVEQCKKEIAELKAQIEQLRGDPEKTPLTEAATGRNCSSFLPTQTTENFERAFW